MTPPVDAPALTDAGRAVAYLDWSGPEYGIAAASGDPEGWGDAGRELIAAADAAGGEPVAQAHVATGDGEAFCVREGGLVAVAVTERFALASLMFFDMRSILRDLAAGRPVEGRG